MYSNIYCDNQQLNVSDDVISRDTRRLGNRSRPETDISVLKDGILETWEHFRLSPNMAWTRKVSELIRNLNWRCQNGDGILWNKSCILGQININKLQNHRNKKPGSQDDLHIHLQQRREAQYLVLSDIETQWQQIMLLALGMKGFDMLVEDFASSNSTSTTNSTTISTTSTALTESKNELETTASGLAMPEQAHFAALVDPNSSNVTTISPSEVTFSTLITETESSEPSTLIETVSSDSRSTMMSSSEGSTILDILTDKTNSVIETKTSLGAKMTTTIDQTESETASSILSTAPSSLKTSFFDESHLTSVISAVSITTLVLIILGIILFLLFRYRKRLGCCEEYHWYKCWYLLCPCEVRW